MLVGTKLKQMQNLQKFEIKVRRMINILGRFAAIQPGISCWSDRPLMLMSFHLLVISIKPGGGAPRLSRSFLQPHYICILTH